MHFLVTKNNFAFSGVDISLKDETSQSHSPLFSCKVEVTSFAGAGIIMIVLFHFPDTHSPSATSCQSSTSLIVLRAESIAFGVSLLDFRLVKNMTCWLGLIVLSNLTVLESFCSSNSSLVLGKKDFTHSSASFLERTPKMRFLLVWSL